MKRYELGGKVLGSMKVRLWFMIGRSAGSEETKEIAFEIDMLGKYELI